MPEDEQFLMRPVLANMCRYESLKDGSVDLADIVRMNLALDVQAENQFRLRKAVQATKPKG